MAYKHLVPGSCQVFTERRIRFFWSNDYFRVGSAAESGMVTYSLIRPRT